MIWKRRLTSVSYQGSAYYGFSVSPSKATIKETLAHKICTLLPDDTQKTDLGFQYSSRTDSGVHALDQQCSFLLPDYLSDQKAKNLLNERLPGDIKIESLVEVEEEYSLRDHVVGKDYYYWISFQPKNPFYASLRWTLPDQYEWKVAQKYLSLLVGEHDFAAFAKNQKQYKSTLCTLYKAEIKLVGTTQWIIQIRGNRFLHHMIRFIVGYMIAWLQSGRSLPCRYEDLFTLTCEPSSLLAPSGGLYLVKTWLDHSIHQNWKEVEFSPFPLLHV